VLLKGLRAFLFSPCFWQTAKHCADKTFISSTKTESKISYRNCWSMQPHDI